MYSTTVIESAIERYETQAKHRLARIDPSRVESWVAHLDKRRTDAGDEETFWKSATREEKLFIRNERVMSIIDFRYAAERYYMMQREGGGICRFDKPWESQEILLRHIAKVEAQAHEAFARNEPVDGILIVLNKARQLGATAIGRLLLMHRLTTQNNRRAMSASVDDDKIQELYDRDKLVYDNLPWYLKPVLRYDEKRQHLHFDGLDSRALYQVSSQKSGLGVGRQFDLAHLTELSTWVGGNLELQFFPTLPQSLSTFALLESTANGRGGWWHDFSTRVRNGVSKRWHSVFIPWYAEISKYRRQPPVDWTPSPEALRHATKVYDSSPEYMGHAVLLERPQLYWWETTRIEHQQGNNLAEFLTNYCATFEESFQHSGQSAFSAELMDKIRTEARAGTSFELVG